MHRWRIGYAIDGVHVSVSNPKARSDADLGIDDGVETRLDRRHFDGNAAMANGWRQKLACIKPVGRHLNAIETVAEQAGKLMEERAVAGNVVVVRKKNNVRARSHRFEQGDVPSTNGFPTQQL